MYVLLTSNYYDTYNYVMYLIVACGYEVYRAVLFDCAKNK